MLENEIKELMARDINTIDEIEKILEYLVKTVRTNLDIKDSSTRSCRESSMALMRLCDKLDIIYIPFNMSEIGMKGLEHHYGITEFSTEMGLIPILLDLTYIQFTEDKYIVNCENANESKSVIAPGNFISENNKENLVKNGYLTLTENNFNDYIRSFIETYKLVNKVNENVIYDNVYNNLNEFDINFVDKDYLCDRGITF